MNDDTANHPDGHQPPDVPVVAPVELHHPPTNPLPPSIITDSAKPRHNGVSAPQPAASKGSSSHDLLTTLGIFITAIVVAILIITFVFRSYQVDGPSMQNTLQNNDKLIIWKVPRTWADITGHPYVPNRGDIIVFTETGLSQFGQQNTKQLIKRVVGLPGDRVTIQNDEYVIYNKVHPNGFDPDKTLPYGKNIPETIGVIDDTLGPDQIFVSGDNRPDSLDSRAFGPINVSQIVGKLVLRVFPVNQAKAF